MENLKQEILDAVQPSEVKQKFAQDLINTWLSYFDTSKADLDLSQQELDTLDSYLYSNLLLINTNQAASRVTRKTWSGIESRMLLPIVDSIQSTDERR